jgi:AbrB family looped-hinge helix DNA binding protein
LGCWVVGNIFWQQTVYLPNYRVMTVTIDKFGRVLIPKKAREVIGLQEGDQLELRVSEHDRSIHLHLKPTAGNKIRIQTTEGGWPVIQYLDGKARDYDAVNLIKEGREERDRKVSGL